MVSKLGLFSSYLSDCSLKHNHNDVPLVHDEEVYKTLKEAGIKELTAKHVAHLFIRHETTSPYLPLNTQKSDEHNYKVEA